MCALDSQWGSVEGRARSHALLGGKQRTELKPRFRSRPRLTRVIEIARTTTKILAETKDALFEYNSSLEDTASRREI